MTAPDPAPDPGPGPDPTAPGDERSVPERRAGGRHGDLIVRLDVAATGWFVLTAVLAAVVFDGVVLWVGALTALTLFLVGMATFLWAFYNAVQRSRTESISVTQLFLLLGGVAPSRVRRVMLSMLAVQIVVGLATALARPNASDGTPGSSLALGVLVPMFGLGLNGLWAAYHGTFGPRDDETADAPGTVVHGDGDGEGGRDDTADDVVRPVDDRIGQNEDHA